MKRLLLVCMLVSIGILLLNLSNNDGPAVKVSYKDTPAFGKIINIKQNVQPNDNWEYQAEIPDDLISSGTYSLLQTKGVWIPRLEPGEQAVKLTSEGINLYLDNGDYQRGELIFLAVYDYDNLNSVTKLGDNSDIQLHVMATPDSGKPLKLIVYRLTSQEFQNYLED